MSRYVRVRDEVSWQQFGVIEPGYFDNYIKDAWLAVIAKINAVYILQDPTDLQTEYIVHQRLLIDVESNMKRAS